jgi:hypothetical protein
VHVSDKAMYEDPERLCSDICKTGRKHCQRVGHEEILGFCTEYMSHFSPTRSRVWDKNKVQSMVDEVLKGKGVRREMSNQVQSWVQLVQENTVHLEEWRR